MRPWPCQAEAPDHPAKQPSTTGHGYRAPTFHTGLSEVNTTPSRRQLQMAGGANIKKERKEPHPEAVEGNIGRALPGPLDLCCPPLSAVPVPESPAPRAGRGSCASPSQPVMGPRSQCKMVTTSLLKSTSRRELVTEPEKHRSPTDHERHEVPARLVGWSSKLKSAREIAQG